FVRWLPEVGWFLFVERPEDEAISGARRAFYLNLVVYVLILILALLTAGFTVNRFQTRLERTASFDPLTGAMNRLAFQTVAEHSIREARRESRPLSVVLFDIDHFKAVNDTLGHAAGDRALKTVVQACKAALRASDLLCRWGGEEFLILLPSSGPDGAFSAAEKVRTAISAAKLGPDGPSVTISAGTATIRPDEDLNSLIQRADERLLEAKRAGRNRTVRAD
ncbi:MAG: GGDEF domain-containing protein, partial [Treponema sp.]|nr:GGDEF domain-containing protein [Treponema sp.]